MTIKNRLQDYTFVDMMVKMREAEEMKKKAMEMIENTFEVYGLTKAGYEGRKKKILEGTTLDQLEKKYK